MNAFVEASTVEERGQRILIPWLRERYDHVVLNLGGRLHLELQGICDCFANKNGQVVAIELKIEERHTGNLFLESFSNKSQYNPGWFVKSNADLLIAYFIDRDACYVLNLPKLKSWAFSNEHGRWLVSHFPERVQGKYAQMNDTWGWCVPLKECMRVAGVGEFQPKKECYSDPFLRAQIQSHKEWLEEYGDP